jgi:hypothetical protein
VDDYRIESVLPPGLLDVDIPAKNWSASPGDLPAEERERRFIGSCIQDPPSLEKFRAIPADAFFKGANRVAWLHVVRAKSVEEIGRDVVDGFEPWADPFAVKSDVDFLVGRITARRGWQYGKKLIDALAARSSSNESEWEVVSAAEMDASPPPVPPVLIDGMLYQGGTMMMSGASKSMKTFTMLDAALAVTTGGAWLGFNCTPVPVVFVNLELQRFAMHSRAKSVAAARGIPMPANLHFLNLRGKLVDIDALEMNLTRLLEKTRAGLVIIDPHYKISSASKVEENSNDAQGLLLYPATLAAIASYGSAAAQAPFSIAAAAATTKAQALLGSGFAEGGRITGPGTSTSDSIFIRASNNEFMVRAAAAQQIGYENLAYMNRTGRVPGSASSGSSASVTSASRREPNIILVGDEAEKRRYIINSGDNDARIRYVHNRYRKF